MAERGEVTAEFVREQVARGRQYWLRFLWKGPRHGTLDEQAAGELQMAHLVYLFTLREQGKLVMNGPLTDDTDLRGVGVVTVESREEAEALGDNDPAVLAGVLRSEIRPWFSIPGDILPA
ncbi:MAG: YciI family protein [Dehalococcoidia bacterium]